MSFKEATYRLLWRHGEANYRADMLLIQMLTTLCALEVITVECIRGIPYKWGPRRGGCAWIRDTSL